MLRLVSLDPRLALTGVLARHSLIEIRDIVTAENPRRAMVDIVAESGQTILIAVMVIIRPKLKVMQ
jgi:hypothetical protein